METDDTTDAVPVPPPVLEPARSTSRGPSAAAMQADLVAVIAEKTGYEPDELEPDFELEADLGIDTVKQAEIFSELRERYGIERDEQFVLADYPTIESLANYLAGAAAAGGASSTGAPASPEPGPGHERAIPIMAEPVAPMADGDVRADLEALIAEKTGYDTSDLEPDFELEADLGIDTVKQAEIFSELRERYGLQRDDNFRLSDYPTIAALAEYLDRARSVGPAPTPTEVAQPGASERSIQDDSPMSSGDRQWFAEEFDMPTGEEPLPSLHGHELPGQIRVRRPVMVPLRTMAFVGDYASAYLLGGGATGRSVRAELKRRGIDVVDAAAEADAIIDLGESVKESFELARTLADSPPRRWLTLTRTGNFEGIYPLARAHSDGARAGFTKALEREWEATRASVLDVTPSTRPKDCAVALVDELIGDGPNEVFIHEEQRFGVEYSLEVPAARGALSPLASILITGGARGISFACVQEIARRGPVRLALVGRGAPGQTPLDEATTKKSIRESLKSQHDRVTPAMIEAELRPLRKAEEIRANLEVLRGLGAEVHYLQADLADTAEVKRMVGETLDLFGTIDIAIHGAGVEESRLIQDKDDAAFARVFNGKALGGLALLEALPAETFFVSMGSVAGRFGNPGQVDYAAANDAMARTCLTRKRALHVDWTAWDEVGMAVRGGMKRLLEDRGVELLPAETGANLLANWICQQTSGELVVAGNLGDFMPAPSHPMLDRIEFAGDTVRVFHRLAMDTDRWIVDHAIDNVPVLPGVVGLELMTAVASSANPGRSVSGAASVTFDQPAKLHRGEPLDLIIEAQRISSGVVRCTLSSERTLKTGRVQQVDHFSANILFGELNTPAALPSAFMPNEEVGETDIYERFFHGPVFRVLRKVLGAARDGLIAEAICDSTRISDGMHTEPLVLEAAFQAAGLHYMMERDAMALPAAIDAVHWLRSPQLDEVLEVTACWDGQGYHIDVEGQDGPICRVRGFAMSELGPIPPEKRFQGPESGRPEAFPRIQSTGPSGPSGAIASATWQDDPTPYLTQTELDALRSRGTERRVRDRIAGRIAAKRALMALLDIDPLSVEVESLESGAPIVRGADARVSITHRDGRAMAMASSKHRVGIDAEPITPRTPAFLEDWFTQGERRLMGDDLVLQTAAWSTKEAVLKVLGTGMALSPRDIEVVELLDGTARVVLRGDAHAHAGKGFVDSLELTWDVADNTVVVQARWAA